MLLRAVRRWLERRSGRTDWGGGRASKVGRMWGLAISRCPDVRSTLRKQQSAAARQARAAKERQVEKDAARFQILMGVEGDGRVTLAPGLEDVDVTFRRRRRANWRPAGRRNRRGRRRRQAAGDGGGADGGAGDGDDSSDDGDEADSGSEYEEETGETEAGFETAAGEDGNGGMGNEAGLVVGDMLRIHWVEEQVWFRCRIEGMGNAGREVRVSYLVDDRWGLYVHSLREVEWERWEPGGDVDPREADFDMDVWVADDELDHEAAAAAAAGHRRQGGESAGGARPRDGAGRSASQTRASEGDAQGARVEAGEGDGASDSDADSDARRGDATDRFRWVVRAAPRGAGLKKRKLLLGALVKMWAEAAGSDGTELPTVQRRAIYKEMARVLSTKQVGAELALLAKAGLVVVEGDGVRCSEGRRGSTGATRRARGDGRGGGEKGVGVGAGRLLQRDSDGGASDTGSTGGDAVGDEEEAVGRAPRGTGKRRRCVASYAESEQESEEDIDGGWD